MIRCWLSVLIVVSSSTGVMAGTVRFEPATAILQPGHDPTLSIELWLDDALDGRRVEALDLRIGSDSVPLQFWDHGEPTLPLLCGAGGCYAVVSEPFPYTMTSIGWFSPEFLGFALPAPFLLGTLTVHVSDLPPGTHYIYVGDGPGGDPLMRDDGFSKVANGHDVEVIQGTGVIVVIPEPTSLSFLALAMSMTWWRRRSRALRPRVSKFEAFSQQGIRTRHTIRGIGLWSASQR